MAIGSSSAKRSRRIAKAVACSGRQSASEASAEAGASAALNVAYEARSPRRRISSEKLASSFTGCSTLGGSTKDPRPDCRLINPSWRRRSSDARAVARLTLKAALILDSDGSTSPGLNSPIAIESRNRSAIWRQSGTEPDDTSWLFHRMRRLYERYDVSVDRTNFARGATNCSTCRKYNYHSELLGGRRCA